MSAAEEYTKTEEESTTYATDLASTTNEVTGQEPTEASDTDAGPKQTEYVATSNNAGHGQLQQQANLDVHENLELLAQSPEQRYQHACNLLDMSPQPHIASFLNLQPTVLNLSQQYIGDRGAIAIAEALTFPITSLNLFFNGIGNQGMRAIINALLGSQTLESLKIGKNDFSPSVTNDLIKLIKSCPNLNDVDTSGCRHIGSEHRRRILEAFRVRDQKLLANLERQQRILNGEAATNEQQSDN